MCDSFKCAAFTKNFIFIFQNVPLEDSKKGLKTIISFLAENAKQVVIMTIPPIPRNSDDGRKEKIKILNDYIAQEAADKGIITSQECFYSDYCFHEDKHVLKYYISFPDNVHVLDIFSKFLLIDESINIDLFEKWVYFLEIICPKLSYNQQL